MVWHTKSRLIAMIDDATSEVHAEFFKSETTQGCFKVMRDFIKSKGIFKALYVDKAGMFGGPKRCNFSQMQRACEELGIEIIFAHSPQGKGRIERAFNTFQDRIIPELRLRNISDMQEANQYLHKIFIPEFWQTKLTVNPKNILSEFLPLPNHLNLDTICIEKEYRKIRNDHTFSYNNKFYLIESPLTYSIAKQTIEIQKQADGNIIAYFVCCSCIFILSKAFSIGERELKSLALCNEGMGGTEGGLICEPAKFSCSKAVVLVVAFI